MSGVALFEWGWGLDWTGGIRECLQVSQHIKVREHDWLNIIEIDHRWDTPVRAEIKAQIPCRGD